MRCSDISLRTSSVNGSFSLYCSIKSRTREYEWIAQIFTERWRFKQRTEELIFHEINIEHIPIVNSWYCDADSFHVKKLTEEFIHYVASNPDYDCWMISSNNEFIGKVDVEIEEDKAYISIIIKPDYRHKGYGKKHFSKS
ncbi:hypothetical protein B6A27_01920 [Anoxybacillus sp. UARK-01]|uniref:GNAT family N-acetyltransferase n=1 Tax=Anoxybacillaceae TaxID=3120669 RepID=UPI0009BC519C|nr:hypothetical protein B6A27_01920 [Anoxybacillus sp. UARK-01]